ncbi:putative Ig domain-containing protein [Parasphingorhabdus sp.]|uniref:putative Ig domain-containing protein n=1 Tax=Parasphingorhabdus sp. TaxID=2709688 RepID=UPI003002A9F6
MADFKVTTTSDTGDDAMATGSLQDEMSDGFGLSLREAIVLSEANGEADTITFASFLQNSTIFAQSTPGFATTSFNIATAEGLIIIGDINGDGTPDITLTSTVLQGRFFNIGASANVVIDGLNISRGASIFSAPFDGIGVGVIANEGNLTLKNVVISDSIARSFDQPQNLNGNTGNPGFTGSTGNPGVTPPSSTLSILLGTNPSPGDGGAGGDGGDGTDGRGGNDATPLDATLIFNSGTLTLEAVTLRNNTFEGGKGGDAGDGGDGGGGGNGGAPGGPGAEQGFGGVGGDGGDGGDGGTGGNVSAIFNTGTLVLSNLAVIGTAISGGAGGDGGKGGIAGQGGLSDRATGSIFGAGVGDSGANGDGGNGGAGAIILNSGGVISGTVVTDVQASGGQGGLGGGNVGGGIIFVGAGSPGVAGPGGTFLNLNGGTGFVSISLPTRVTTTLDVVDASDGLTSLREAIAYANSVAGVDTITFATGTGEAFETGGVIRLALGEIVITDPLTILGGGLVTITGDVNGDDVLVAGTDITDVTESLDGTDRLADNTRVLSIGSLTGEVTLSGLTITGGRTTANFADGAGVRSQATSLVVENSVISGNSTSGDSFAEGAGIKSSGNTTIINSMISENFTTGSIGRGAGVTSFGELNVTDSGIIGNSASGANARGGGILGFAAITLTNTTVSGNSTGGTNSSGGGVFGDTTVTLMNSTVSGNSTAGTISPGGGIFARILVSATNSTFSGNFTTNNFGDGGAIAVGYDAADQTGVVGVALTNSTVTGNTTAGFAADGGGIYLRGGDLALTNSILLGNAALQSNGNEFSESAFFGLDGATTNSGLSILGTGNDSDASDGVVNANPAEVFATTLVLSNGTTLAGVVADNGGPVQTVALNADAVNPALDASGAGATASDARGELALDQPGLGADSTAPGIRDLGAFELATLANWRPVLANALADRTSDEDTPVSFTIPANAFSDVNGDTLSYAASLGNDDPLPAWLSFTAATRTFSGTPPQDFNGALDLKVTASDGSLAASDSFTLTITPVNDAPAGSDKTVSILEDNSHTFAASDFGFSDVDTGDALLSVRIDTLSLDAGATLKLNGTSVSVSDAIPLAQIANLVFTPGANQNGAAYSSFTFSVSDGTTFDPSPNTLTIDVTPVNDAPAGSDKTVSILEDNSHTFAASDFGFSDVDAGDALLSVRIDTLSLDAGATLKLNGTSVSASDAIPLAQIANLVFTPGANQNGAAYSSFTFSVSDGNTFDPSPNTLTIDVTPVNDVPAGSDKTVSILEDNSHTFAASDFGFSDVDTGDALLSVRIDTLSLDAGATLKLNGTSVSVSDAIPLAQIANLVFTPGANQNGAAYSSFTFSVSDGNTFDPSPNTLTIDVTPVNDVPVLENQIPTQFSLEDEAWSYEIPADTFIDVDGDTLSFSATLGNGDPLPAWLTFNAATRTFSGTPPLDFAGLINLKVTASDGEFAVSDKFSLRINPVNDAPRLAIADQNSPEDARWLFKLPAESLFDPDNISLNVSARLADGSALPQWLTFIAGSRTFFGKPPANFNRGLEIEVTASDGELTTSDIFTLAIDPVNDAPVLANAIADQSSDEDAAFSFVVPANAFSDIDGDTLSFTTSLGNDDPLPAWLSFTAATRTFAGTPPQEFNGSLDVKVTASDSEFSASDQFTLTIDPVNDAPEGVDDSYNTDEDAALTVNALTGVLANDSDSDGDSLTVALVSDVTSGALVLNADGSFAYTPDPDFNGSDSFTYEVSDGNITTGPVTVSLTIAPVNDAPVLANAIADQSSEEDTPYSFVVPANAFSDVEGDTLSFIASLGNEDPLPAWLSFNAATRTFSGTPPQDFNGALDVNVTASDGSLSASDTFTLTIDPVNDAPVLANAIADQSSDEDAPYSFVVPANAFSDVDGDTLSFTARLGNDDPLPAWLTFTAATRTFSGTPPQDFNGSLDVKITASDGSLSASDQFTLTIDPVNDAPVLANAIADQSSDEDAAFSFVVPANAFNDVDGDTLSFTASLGNEDPLPAWLTFDPATRTFSGTPPQDFNGALDLKVAASDGEFASSDTFTLTIDPVNDAPVLANAITDQSSDEDAAWSFVVPANAFSDIDGDTLSFTASLGNDDPLPAWLSFTAATRTFSGTPPQDFNGSLDVKVTASDGSLSANDTFTLTIDPVNDAPVVIPASQTLQATAGETATFTVSATDADGDDLSYAAGPAGKGIVTVSGADVTYTAVPFASGSDSFTVTVSDGNGGSAVQSVAVSIAAAPLPPEDFRLVLTEGWTGSVGGNGRVSGSNGFEDLTLLYGAISLDGSFNRGGDVVRFDGEASGYSVSRAGSSAALITNNTDLGAIIPIGTAGLFTDFDDGARKLVFSGGYKLGAQVFTADSTPITAPDDGSILPTLADPAAKATLELFGAALQPGQDANVTIGGNVQIRGTNGADIVRLDENGGDFAFDGSFNRGGDIIVLGQEAAAYTASLQGSSTMLIASQVESLAIPIGTVGLTLRFTDGDRILLFENGEYLIGEQVIDRSVPAQLDEFIAVQSLDQGSSDAAITLSGAAGKILFTDDADISGNSVLEQFASDDLISVINAAADDYSFAASSADPADLEITYASGAASNRIILDNILPSGDIVSDYPSAVHVIGWEFMSFG